jgi:hypothetical protein
MANQPVQLNLLPPPAPAALPVQPAPNQNQIISLFHASIRSFKGACEGIRCLFSSAAIPTDLLGKIERTAREGLDKGKIQNKPVYTNLHRQIDQELSNLRNSQQVVRNTPEVGEIAVVENLPVDPDVTLPPALQNQQRITNWHKETEVRLESLSEKLSVFTALQQMRSRCGMPEKDNLALMNLVKKATDGPNPLSVWEIFTTFYEGKLTLFQKVKAAWFYWIYYQTSLIHRIIHTYLGSFVEYTKNNLTNKDTLPHVFRILLKNINQFLIEDIKATKNFAYEKEYGDLDDCQGRAIERHYGLSLTDLCQKFAEARIEKDSPYVPIFSDLQQIPILCWGFKCLEYLINRFIIQNIMRAWILPSALESGVTKGFEEIQPDKLPFAISLTNFLIERLEQLQKELAANKEEPLKAKGIFPGTEALPKSIKYLKQVLFLMVQGKPTGDPAKDQKERVDTQIELRKRFAELEQGKSGGFSFIPEAIDEAIEKSITDGGDLLFRYLSETAQSGELFQQALKLAEAPFSTEAKEQDLQAIYKARKSKLNDLSHSVFEKMVEKSVSKEVKERLGFKGINSHQIARNSFESQKKILNLCLDELQSICERMTQKLQLAEQAPEENNLQDEISSFLQTTEVLMSRKEIAKPVEDIRSIDQTSISRRINPLFVQANEIQEKVIQLQKLQETYPRKAGVALQLKEILTSLEDLSRQPHNPLIQTLKESVEKIYQYLGKDARLPANLSRIIQQISDLSQGHAEEEQALTALSKLYQPRQNVNEPVSKGLFEQLIEFQQTWHFRPPRQLLEEIAQSIRHLPEAERTELKRIIGDGSNLQAKWAELSFALQKTYENHLRLKGLKEAQFKAIINEAKGWLQQKITRYDVLKKKDHQEMEKIMKDASAQLKPLKEQAKNIELTLAPSRIWGASTYFESIANTPKEDSSWRSVATKVTFTSTLGAAAYFSPLVGTAYYAGAAVAGLYGLRDAGKLVVAGLKSYTNKKVLGLFNSAYEFGLQPRIYKAAATRAMKVMS